MGYFGTIVKVFNILLTLQFAFRIPANLTETSGDNGCCPIERNTTDPMRPLVHNEGDSFAPQNAARG
jgi:hypothetical protein